MAIKIIEEALLTRVEEELLSTTIVELKDPTTIIIEVVVINIGATPAMISEQVTKVSTIMRATQAVTVMTATEVPMITTDITVDEIMTAAAGGDTITIATAEDTITTDTEEVLMTEVDLVLLTVIIHLMVKDERNLASPDAAVTAASTSRAAAEVVIIPTITLLGTITTPGTMALVAPSGTISQEMRAATVRILAQEGMKARQTATPELRNNLSISLRRASNYKDTRVTMRCVRSLSSRN